MDSDKIKDLCERLRARSALIDRGMGPKKTATVCEELIEAADTIEGLLLLVEAVNS